MEAYEKIYHIFKLLQSLLKALLITFPYFMVKPRLTFSIICDYTKRPPEMSFPRAKRVGNPSEHRHLWTKQQKKIPDKPE
jgi:hypothetical protein